jgi:hypothetical protein
VTLLAGCGKMENMTVEEYRKRSREYEMSEARKGLLVHAAITAVVSIVLAAVNLAFVPQFIWFIFPVVGMSIGMAAHYVFGVRMASRFIEDRERRIENWR